MEHKNLEVTDWKAKYEQSRINEEALLKKYEALKADYSSAVANAATTVEVVKAEKTPEEIAAGLFSYFASNSLLILL